MQRFFEYSTEKCSDQLPNYGGAQRTLAHLKDLTTPAKNAFREG